MANTWSDVKEWHQALEDFQENVPHWNKNVFRNILKWKKILLARIEEFYKQLQNGFNSEPF